MHVTLNDHVFNHSFCRCMNRLLSRQCFWISRQKYALTLTTSFRFYYERPITLAINLREELFKVIRQVVRSREKVIIFREHRLQPHQVST